MSNPETGYESTTMRLERPAAIDAGASGRADAGAASATAAGAPRVGTSQPCALIEDLLPLYIEGEVSPGSRDVIVEHLAQCAHCAGFLAGAQSVRVQLRQEQRQRAVVMAASAPDRQVVAQGQRGMAILTTLAGCVLGFFGSMMFFGSIEGGGAGLGIPGIMVGVAGFWLMASLARKLGVLSIARFIVLLGVWGAVTLSSIMMSVEAGGPVGIFMWMLATPFLWMLATSGSAWPSGPAAPARAVSRPASPAAPSARAEDQGPAEIRSSTLSMRRVSGGVALGLIALGSAMAFSALMYDPRTFSILGVIGIGAFLLMRER